jgi:hypothetical protein
MEISKSNKNACTLFNRQSVKYLVVELGSIEHLEAVKKGYEYRGPAYVANITEIHSMSEANKLFMDKAKLTLTNN